MDIKGYLHILGIGDFFGIDDLEGERTHLNIRVFDQRGCNLLNAGRMNEGLIPLDIDHDIICLKDSAFQRLRRPGPYPIGFQQPS